MGKIPQLNRPSFQQYQRQRFWQIIFPILIISLLMVVVAGFTIIAGPTSDRLWADISIIWLVIPVLFSALIVLVVTVGLIYLMTRLLMVFPIYSRKVQNFFYRIEQGTHKAATSVIKPIVWMNQLGSRFREFFKRIKI